ncbi:MAG: hypothetical protein K0B07_05540 [DPANN group archaeon]|nr:hypothetical protein [DPANN group archaeon]
MNKKYFLIVVGLFLVLFSASVYAESYTCTDTDGGKIYGVAGTVTFTNLDSGISAPFVDECDLFNPNLLLENYCISPTGMYATEIYTCPYGCNAGQCNPAPIKCQYYDYDFSPPAGPVSGCGSGFTCCLDTCIACGSGKTVCCSLDGKDASCYDPSAGELCLEDGSIRKINCDDLSDPNYCDGYCDFCSDGVKNCDETCVDGGGSCVTQNAETFIQYIPVFEIGNIYPMSSNTAYISSLSMVFSNSVFCYDNIDNDNDCYVDSADTDCPSTPPPGICIDADGDGYGVGSFCLGTDCDDTDSNIWVNCDTTPPEVNIVINNDAIYTNNLTVILNLTYYDDESGVASNGCMFSNDGVFDTESWEACSETKLWNLIGLDGTKTVYVQVKDNDGNVNSTESDSIILDTLVPTIVVESPLNSPYIYDTQWIMFNVTANDTMSGVVQCEFSINNTPNKTLVNDFGDHYHFFNKSVYVGTYEVIYYCNDSAGNMGSVVVNLDVQYDCMLNEDLDPECRTVKYCYLNEWITDSDNSTAACCCISSGYWDDVSLCCDSSDDWLTSSGDGVCTTGVIRGEYFGPTCSLPFLPEVEKVFVCNEIDVNGTKVWWNGSDWTIMAPQYCGCTQNSDCDSLNNELCMDNICLIANAPVIFIENINTIHMGDTIEFIIEITNNMNVSDNVELTLSGIISNWVWFKGKQNMKPHNMVVTVPPRSSKKVIVNVFGGKLGVYTLNVYAESLLTLMDKTADASIRIISVEQLPGAKKVNTPDMSGISFVLVLLFGLVTMYFRKP